MGVKFPGMKTRIISIAVLAFILAGLVITQGNQALVAAASGGAHEPIKRGAALGASPVVALTEVLQNPTAYAEKSIMVEGQIERVCTNKGCWLELVPQAGEAGMRVTFKNYGFFVPVDSKGMKIKAEGHVVVKTLSREKADHYAGEGAQIKRNADGTATEITFVAAGVELYR